MQFVKNVYDLASLADISVSSARRFMQDQVLTFHVKPRTMQRRNSCLKSFSQYCLPCCRIAIPCTICGIRSACCCNEVLI